MFVLGESAAMRVDLTALAAELKAGGAAMPRLIPAGMGAYDAARTRLVLDEVLGLDADAVVFLVGHNEHPLLPPPGRLGRRLRAFFRSLWLSRLSASLLPRRSEASLRAGMERRFADSVRAMLRASKARGAAAVVCLLPANIRGWPPRGELPLDDEDFLDGVLAERSGRVDAARQAYERFGSRRPDDAAGLFTLARLRSVRDPKAAAAGFAAALERDNPERATPTRNQALRRLARDEGAATADLEAAWRPLSPPAGPGWELFQDGVHWRPFLNASAAGLIADALASVAAERPVTPPAPPALDAGELGTLLLTAYAEAIQASQGPSPFLSERAVAMFQRAADSDPGALRAFLRAPQAAQRRIEQSPWSTPLAPMLLPSWWGVLAHAGEALARSGRGADAAGLWDEAMRLKPSAPLVSLLRAIDLAGRGLHSEAHTMLEAIPEGTRERFVADLLRRRLTRKSR